MMAIATVPTTISPAAQELAKHYGVERELDAILDQGQRTVRGLLSLDVDSEGAHDMGEPCIVIVASVDPAFENDPSHLDWWSWRTETFGVHTALRFLVCFSTSGS